MILYVMTEKKNDDLFKLEQQRGNKGVGLWVADIDAVLVKIDTLELGQAFLARDKSFDVLQAYSQALTDICALAEG